MPLGSFFFKSFGNSSSLTFKFSNFHMFKFSNTLIACLFVRGFPQFSSRVVRLPRYTRDDLATKSKKWLSQLIFHFSLKVSYYVYIIRNVFTRWSKRLKKYKLLVLHKMRKKNQVHAKRDIIWWLRLTRICDKLFEDAGPPTSSAKSENTQHREERIHRRGRDRVLRLVRAKRTSCRRTSDTS